MKNLMLEMRLSNQQALSIQRQIETLLQGHIAQPFRILREAGVAAELRGLLLADPSFSSAIPAQVHPLAGKSPSLPRTVQVASVQLEVTALLDANHGSVEPAKTLDIAILRPGCALTYTRNAPGDVIRKIHSNDLTAAIEVKASPSNDLSTGGAYAKDIAALLRLASLAGVIGYFVLLDKSSALYGPESQSASPYDQNESPRWMQDRPDAFLYERDVKQGSRKRYFGNLRQKNITVCRDRPASGVPHVQVWTVEHDASRRTWSPVKRFAF